MKKLTRTLTYLALGLFGLLWLGGQAAADSHQANSASPAADTTTLDETTTDEDATTADDEATEDDTSAHYDPDAAVDATDASDEGTSTTEAATPIAPDTTTPATSTQSAAASSAASSSTPPATASSARPQQATGSRSYQYRPVPKTATSAIVYINPAIPGRYHKNPNCRGLHSRGGVIRQMTLAQAQQQGYTYFCAYERYGSD